MIRIKDIAKKCKVSISTVSKALNGASDLSDKTAEKIRKTSRDMGYIPNANARVLKTNKSQNIGVLFVDKTSSGLKHEYFSSILNSIKVEAESKDYDITFISNAIGKNSMTYYEHAKYRGCDGVIIASVDFLDPQVIELVNSEIPSVTIDYTFNNKSSIMSDNSAGLEDIVHYLYKMGHRKIAFIHGEDTAVTQKRLTSFYRTMQSLGLSVDESLVKAGIYHHPKSSGLATREILSSSDWPTCIIYPDDYSMLAGITEIEKHNLTIPDGMSIVGYDGIELSRCIRPMFTTYVQDSEQIGRKAADKLIQTIENPLTTEAETVMVKGYLQEGKTVKALIN